MVTSHSRTGLSSDCRPRRACRLVVARLLYIMEEQLYEVCVPAGVAPGQAFQVQIGGALMAVQCPPDVRPGETIQATTVRGSVAHCTVAQQYLARIGRRAADVAGRSGGGCSGFAGGGCAGSAGGLDGCRCARPASGAARAAVLLRAAGPSGRGGGDLAGGLVSAGCAGWRRVVCKAHPPRAWLLGSASSSGALRARASTCLASACARGDSSPCPRCTVVGRDEPLGGAGQSVGAADVQTEDTARRSCSRGGSAAVLTITVWRVHAGVTT